MSVFVDTLMFKAPGAVVYWFFWMMIYVYMLMPFINRGIVNSKFNIEYLLIVWFVFITIAYPLNNQYLYLISDFISPIALVVLGYY